MPPISLGIFIPIGNNGWLISSAAPQYKPSFALNKSIVQRAEKYGFDFALSMIKLRGFGGKTEFWDHNLESFTLMSALAAVTTRIKLIASSAILTLPPAVVARMASTVDSVAPGRFGINIVTGWQSAEYSQMGLWPGDAYFGYRYDYATEYVRIMRDLWSTGTSSFQGKHFTMEDCKLSPAPSAPIDVVVAGQSDRGVKFASELADYNFCMGIGYNTPLAYASSSQRLVQASKETGRDVGTYVLFMLIFAPTDSEAEAKWEAYKDGVDVDAVDWMLSQSSKDVSAGDSSTAKKLALPEGAVNLNMGTLVGSYEKVAGFLDEVAEVEGTKGIMLVFDDYERSLDEFHEKVDPLRKFRKEVANGNAS